ncbi:hypothetical protein AMELA_G00012000 [Ameiurus melas]|uniref:Uncharacterized protein n=1 Tax=Ameiurus melas TaxID=219545 RepID=A0A7J6BJJ2_AMEME|nr:hypothetical protein AMELA_G00012000 [Ameiurus melas]
MASDASHMLEAALEQMDDIIAGSKVMVEFTNGMPDMGSPVSVGPLQVLQLAEELRLALELQGGEVRDTLRSQMPCSTAQTLLEWLDKGMVNRQPCSNNETYQARLERLEGDKESLVLQVSHSSPIDPGSSSPHNRVCQAESQPLYCLQKAKKLSKSYYIFHLSV